MTLRSLGPCAAGAALRVCLILTPSLAWTAGVQAASTVVAANDRVVVIVPDAAQQSALAEFVIAADRATVDARLDQFSSLRGDDAQRLIPQLVWFAARHPQSARTRALVGQVLTRLNTPRDLAVATLIPHLDNHDAAVRAVVQDLLRGYEDRSATRPADFSAYRAFIASEVQAGREPQPSLVRFMFESEPGTALQTLVRALQLRDPDEIKSILWSEHVVAELFWKRRYGFVERNAVDGAALTELEKLSRHPRWWVRRYVAQIVRTHPDLGEPAVLKRLKDDADVRVRAGTQIGGHETLRNAAHP